MSTATQLPPLTCNTCGSLVYYTPIKSNGNGNQGKLMARCTKFNPQTGIQCHFFRSPPASRCSSASLSPGLNRAQPLPPPPFPTFPLLPTLPAGQTMPQAISAAPAITVQPMQITCRTLGCNSTRIRKGCDRKLCRAHCVEAGGCTQPPHQGPQSTAMLNTKRAQLLIPGVSLPVPPVPLSPARSPLAAGPPSYSPPPRLQAPSGLQSLPSSSRQPLSQSSTWPTSSSSRAQPVYSSHIVDVFTAQMAVEEKLRESRRQMEANRLDSKRKIQQTVSVYAWIEDDIAPTLFEIQEGFTWPNFILNEAVLLLAGFADVAPTTRLNLFRFSLGHWTMVPINHVVDVKDNSTVFIKACEVKSCEDFELYRSSVHSTLSPPNIRTNLARERTFIKQQLDKQEVSTLLYRKHRLSTRPSTPPPKRRRIEYVDVETSPSNPPTPTPPSPLPRPITRASTRVSKHRSRPQKERHGSDSDSGPDVIRKLRPTTAALMLAVASTSTSMATTSSSTSTFTVASPLASTSPTAPSTPSIASTSTPALSDIRYIIPSTRLSQQPKWPADFFAVDIIQFFEDVESMKNQAETCSLFEQRFGGLVKFNRSTFHDHRARWRQAGADVKDSVLQAGRTEDGCWSRFMAETQAPRAHIKALRREARKNSVPLIEGEVLDLTSDCE